MFIYSVKQWLFSSRLLFQVVHQPQAQHEMTPQEKEAREKFRADLKKAIARAVARHRAAQEEREEDDE